MNDNKGDNILLVIVLIIFFLIGSSCARSSHEEKIQTQIQSVNGEVVSIEKNIFHVGDPFFLDGKYDDIYKITYKVNGQVKEGWVRFRTFGTDWKLD
jgi:hypothetical protein